MITMVIFICLVMVVILLVQLRHKIKHKRFYQLLEQFPSYPTYPLIGNANLLIGSIDGCLERIEKMMQPYERLVYWMGPIPILLLKNYDDIATVLSQNHDRETLGITEESLGTGLLTARYGEWKTSRRILNPAFSSEMLSKYAQVFQKRASSLVDEIKSVADTDKQTDVMDLMMNMSLESIIENTIGISIQDSEEMGENFCEAILEGLYVLVKRLQMPWLLSSYIFMIYAKITGFDKRVKHVKNLPTKILRNKLSDLENTKYSDNTTIDDVKSSRAVIDLLIKKSLEEPTFTETRMRDELLQIIAAGVETTAITMSFLLLMLAINQDVQKTVYEEITHFLPEDDDDATIENHLIKFKYLEQCIQETLRMFSPVIVTARRIHKDVLLKDNKIVPANTMIATFLYLANQDNHLYKNPSKWDPDHFSDQAIKERPKISQLSFGYGPRSCIGAKYAMMSIKFQTIYILREYHLTTDIKEITKYDLRTDLSIRSKVGYPIKFTSRRKQNG